MSRVLISAGHTAMDPGAIFQDLREADLTRKIAPKIISALEKAGVEVQGVPLDLPLWQRLEWINNTGFSEQAGDVLLEVHINDGDGSKRGIEAWYKGNGNNESQKFGKAIVDTLVESGYQSQGLKSEYQHELGSLTFLNRPKATPVLIETLFLDNPEDIKLLKSESELDKLAKTIAKGILKYFGKDESGQELPENLKQSYAELTTYQPAESETNESDDFDMSFADDFSLPIPSTKTTAAAPVQSPAMSLNSPTFPTAGTNSPFGSATSGSSMMMDRQQRKQMIEDNYQKIMGRMPTQADLNYFLNMGISEVDLVKKMADSQEHADLVASKEKLVETEGELQEAKSKIAKLEVELKDKIAMLDSMNTLVGHKNKAIQNLEKAFSDTTGVPSQVAVQKTVPLTPITKPEVKLQNKSTFSERLFKFLSKRV
jgi:N-acetylmuramoyl-L-alanine amidase